MTTMAPCKCNLFPNRDTQNDANILSNKKTNLREPLKLVSEWLHAPRGKWGNSGNSKSVLAHTTRVKRGIRAYFCGCSTYPLHSFC